MRQDLNGDTSKMKTFCSRQKKEAQQLQMAKFNLPNALEKNTDINVIQ